MTARLGFGLITAAVLAASAPAAPAAEPGAMTPLAMRAALPARTAVVNAEAVQLQFQARPAWQQRLEQISRKGLPLLNLRRNANTDLVFGMNNRGFLGVYTVAHEELPR